MNRIYRSMVSVLFICLFTGAVAWVYLEDVIRVAGESGERAFYPPPIGHYPAQYLPFLAVLPAPTSSPAPVPTLHLGLQLQWDGQGYIYFDNYYWNPGTHERRVVDQQVDADTVRILGHLWYSPNPFDWPDDNWYCNYNSLTNNIEICSSQGDPAWKWGYPWILPTDLELANGQSRTIDGQIFNVTGPHTYLTGYGEQVQFWRLVNRDRFLYHHNGNEWKQYVEVGDAVLFYEYNDSRLLLFSNIKRTYYRNDNWTGDTVRYEDVLTQFDGLLNVSTELRNTTNQIKESQEDQTLSGEEMKGLLDELEINLDSVLNHP